MNVSGSITQYHEADLDNLRMAIFHYLVRKHIHSCACLRGSAVASVRDTLLGAHSIKLFGYSNRAWGRSTWLTVASRPLSSPVCASSKAPV